MRHSIHILIALCIVFCWMTKGFSQDPQQGESFTLNAVLPSNQSHEYMAGNYIELNPGFRSEPQGNNSTLLGLDPYYNTPNEYGIPYATPSDQSIDGRLGFYSMDFHVNECGAATISLPLEFPEGINGMTPHLSLEYNSQAGNGIMGLGWSLGGMSKISRVPYTFLHNDENHSVTFSINDQLSLDGNILKKGTYEGVDCYYPELYDYSIVFPQDDGFKVLKKDGTVCYYGLDENRTSQYYIQGITDCPIEWHLSKVVDPFGNQMELFYGNDTDKGSFRPDSIIYGANIQNNIAYSYSIRFIYSNSHRNDTQRKYFSENNNLTGSSLVADLLESVNCYFNGEKILQYRLEYGNLDWNVKNLIHVSKQFFQPFRAEEGVINKWIPTSFGWKKTDYRLDFDRVAVQQDLGTVFDRDFEWYQQAAFMAKFELTGNNSDAKYESDLVHLLTHNNNNLPKYRLTIFRNENRIDSSGQEYHLDRNGYYTSHADSLINDGRVILGLFPVDTNMDGIDEILCVFQRYQNTVLSLITKDSSDRFDESICKTLAFSGSTSISDLNVTDLTGDGLPDLFFLVNNTPSALISSYDNPFQSLITSNLYVGNQCRIVVGDFDNDKRSTILILKKTSDSQAWGQFLRVEYNGNYFFTAPEGSQYEELTDMARYYHQMEYNHLTRLCRGDFNGDGKQDVVLFCTLLDSVGGVSSNQWRFYFSKGHCRFTEAVVYDLDSIVASDSFNDADENSSLALVDIADFDKDGCDDISIAKIKDKRHGDFYYHHLYRRAYLIHPTADGIRARKIRNTKLEWVNNPQEQHGGHNDTVDISIDSIRAFTTMYASINPFLRCMGNTKGVSPTEILFMRISGNEELEWLYHYNCPIGLSLVNTGCLDTPPSDVISSIVTSLGAKTEIAYRPFSCQEDYGQGSAMPPTGSRDIQPMVPYFGFMNVVDSIRYEMADSTNSDPKSWRTEKYHFINAWYHTRGRGFVGFDVSEKYVQGQDPSEAIRTRTERTLNNSHYLLIPERTINKVGIENESVVFDSTAYTFSFQDSTCFASALGQIPSGVFAPYLSSSVTVRNDGTPLQYEKTETERDGYGNVTMFKRRYSNNASRYYEKTVTAYEHNVGSSRWILGVPNSETVTLNLTDVAADKVVRHTTWQNDMAHGRHRSKTTESGTAKQLTETYGYDAFGNLDTVTRDIGDGHPRTELSTHSADGRFLTSRTNAAGHTTHYHWDAATGLLDSVTDPNGLTTKYHYDYLWDLKQTEYPSGVREDRCMRWVDTCHQHTNSYHPDTPGFGAPVWFTWSKRSGERESVVFYDQHRRKLREVGGTMDGRKVYVDYRYHDVTGLLTAVSAPYSPSDGETAQFTQYTYDYLDRMVRADRPDGGYESHSYNGSTETVRGFDGQGKTLTYSPAGLVTKVSDNGSSGSVPVDIDYHYYGDGKVKDAKVGGDNATLTAYTYDANRNPATVSDPSLGQLTYDYDGFGELVASATPRDTSVYVYDALDRMTSRIGSDGTSVWTYDDGFLGAVSQTVYTPVSGSAVEETFTYDNLGRLTGQTQQVGTGETWSFGYGYDALGRRNTVTYPSGKRFKWHYDRNGFMDWVSDADKGTVVWQATATDRWGNVTDFTEGNIHVSRDYDAVTGLVEGVSARKDGQPVFGQACQWTNTGNLEWRTDTTLNLKETFGYDRFNRLETACVKNLAGTVTHATQGIEFDGKGNITGKDGVGGFAYGGANPYAVTALGPDNAVASILTDQTVAYTPFDKVASVTQDGKTLTVGYGIDRQRVVLTLVDGNTRRTKRYFTPLYETVTENGSTEKIHYLTSVSGLFAIFVKSSSPRIMHYTLKDHQGSLAATVHGNTVERLSYDPWGRRRNTTDFGYANVSHTFDRGYTLHEHYDEFDLINMNGRLYDPILGRMLSPDVVIQDEQNSQAYNRYSYCFNNPLRFTDPSGYVVRGARDYYDWSSMTYYDFGRFKNKGSAFNTDLSEGKFSPIYDMNGFFLGTDDEGIQGDAIVMRRENFKQGMSHEDALAVATELDDNNKDAEIRLYSHFSQLRNRPDWDGYLTLSEANEWYRNGNGQALYTDLSKIDLSGIASLGENYVGQEKVFNLLFNSNSLNDGLVYGKVTLKRYPNHSVKAYADMYDFDIKPWSNPLNWGRNLETIIGKQKAGEGISFEINIYGLKQLTPILPWIK